MTTTLSINGQQRSIEAPPDTPLLWVLRDELGMTGTKFGCGMALCGACTVHMNGSPIRSCVTPISVVGNQPIATIENMENDEVGRAVQRAWVDLSVPQCGYCQAGQIMSAVGLLRTNRTPSDDDISGAMGGNICRCGTYHRIHAAVKQAAAQLSGGKTS